MSKRSDDFSLEGQTSSDQLDWGQYVVYTRKQVPSLKEDNQWLYIKMHWLFLLCWFSHCIFILLCCLQYCIASLCLWTRNVSGVGNAFSDSNEVCYIAALIASGNVSPDYDSGLSQLIPPDKCSFIRKNISKIWHNIPTRIVLPVHFHILGLFLLAYIYIYIFWGLDDLYQAGFLRSLLGLLAACSVDPTLDGGSQGAWPMTDHIHLVWCDGCKEYVEPSWMPKTIPKMPGAFVFFVSFWKLIWNLWTRKVTNVNKEDAPGYAMHKLSAVFCQFWKVPFWLWPRAQTIWPKHRPWRIRRLGECTFMHSRFAGRTLAMRCAVWQWIYGMNAIFGDIAWHNLMTRTLA